MRYEKDTSINFIGRVVADHSSPGIFLFGKNKPFCAEFTDVDRGSNLVCQCCFLAGKQDEK
jgi:hypothetical protein